MMLETSALKAACHSFSIAAGIVYKTAEKQWFGRPFDCTLIIVVPELSKHETQSLRAQVQGLLLVYVAVAEVPGQLIEPSQLIVEPAWPDKLVSTSGTPLVTVHVLSNRLAKALHSARVLPEGVTA